MRPRQARNQTGREVPGHDCHERTWGRNVILWFPFHRPTFLEQHGLYADGPARVCFLVPEDATRVCDQCRKEHAVDTRMRDRQKPSKFDTSHHIKILTPKHSPVFQSYPDSKAVCVLGYCVLAGTRAAAPFPAPLSPLAASFLRYAPDEFLLTKLNTCPTIKEPASLRSDGVHLRPGMVFGFPPEWCSASPESPAERYRLAEPRRS